MARTDRSRIEVFPVAGGFRLQRFDKYGRKMGAHRKVFTQRNNCRREALKIVRALPAAERSIPILTVAQEFAAKPKLTTAELDAAAAIGVAGIDRPFP